MHGVFQELFYNPLAWANTTVYDFKNQLKSGAMTLYMWTYAEDMLNEEIFHALGTVVSNPNKRTSTALMLNFKRCDRRLFDCFCNLLVSFLVTLKIKLSCIPLWKQ